jgi:hypothetical protein
MSGAPAPDYHDEIYGLMAEFDSPNRLIEVTQGAYDRGFRLMEAYTPFPVEGLDLALGYYRNKVPRTVFAGAVLGGLSGFLLQCWSAMYYYPHNIAGKPLYSWPAFIPITFEMTILGGAFAAVFGMLYFNGLPRLYHPVFNVPEFVLASDDRFFLCIQSRDPLFDPKETLEFLETCGPRGISIVPH